MKKKLLAAGAVVVLGSSVPIAGCAFSAPRYRGPLSDHFDGEQFHNLGGASAKSTREALRWMLARRPGKWEAVANPRLGEAPPRRVDGLRVTFINHASTLIQVEGRNILTDPIWSERCSPVTFAGPKRVRPAGIRFEDLPPIDLVLVSHNHYDHLDLSTLERLAKAFPDVQFVTGLGNAQLLRQAGIERVQELDWWQSADVAGVKLNSVPVQHFSNRGLFDRNGTLWTGFVIASASGPIFFAGDTGFGPHFAEIRKRFGAMRLAVLPIGAYKPEWFMGPIHETPAQAVDAAKILGARVSVPMHYGTFPLADDGQHEPLDELKIALADEDAPPFWILDFGEGRDVPP